MNHPGLTDRDIGNDFDNVCPYCLHEIDPYVCWCGSNIPHTYYDGHTPVPMGCTCYQNIEYFSQDIDE